MFPFLLQILSNTDIILYFFARVNETSYFQKIIPLSIFVKKTNHYLPWYAEFCKMMLSISFFTRLKNASTAETISNW